MFPMLFRRFYRKAKIRIEAENHMRIAQETPSGGVSCMEYAYLASEGNVVAAPSYRTIDCCTLREQIEDIFSFFYWIEKHHKLVELARYIKQYKSNQQAGGLITRLSACFCPCAQHPYGCVNEFYIQKIKFFLISKPYYCIY